MYDIIEEISKLKKERNAIILAHYYEDGEIQDIADEVGDSFYLAKKGQESQHSVILLSGVVFMAESVKILNPNKKILVPDLHAGCSLVDTSPFEEYLEWRKQNPKAIAVTYINSSALVKSISDVIVTSSNAKKIISSIPLDRPILFGPDANLGRYLMKSLQRPLILWPGQCQVHVLFSSKKLFELKEKYSDALVLAHPECEEDVLEYADVIGSTSLLLETVHKSSHKSFIVATETGILHQMRKVRPDALLIQAPNPEGTCGCNHCPFMKMNTLEKIHAALKNLQPQIDISENIRKKAQIPLDRMMSLTSNMSMQEGETHPLISWPEFFEY